MNQSDATHAPGRATARIAEIVVDCTELDVAMDFWSAALGYARGWSGGPFAQLRDPSGRGPALLFQRVPEAKLVKNRLHLDLSAPDVPAEVERLTHLGARFIREVSESGATWSVMQDPEGNEFCVVAEGSSGG